MFLLVSFTLIGLLCVPETISSPSELREGLCEEWEMKCKFSDVKPERRVIPTIYGNKYMCGHRSYPFYEEGSGGDGSQSGDSNYLEFPWMVAVLEKERSHYLCGGVLIHPMVVLTAAHCLEEPAIHEIKVRLGEWNISNSNEMYVEQELDIREIHIPDNYNSDTGENDIAMLFLDSAAILAENVQPICLPPLHREFEMQGCFGEWILINKVSPIRFHFIGTAWGMHRKGNKTCREILRKVDLVTIPKTTCEMAIKRTNNDVNFEISDSSVCTATYDCEFDMCGTDLGSPLICPIKDTIVDRYYLVGIFSWRIKCSKYTPSVFTSVVELRSWIDEILLEKGINTEGFIY